MSADRYSPLTRKLFADLQHIASEAGEPSAGASVYLDGQGVRLRLSGRVENGALTGLGFRAYGCPHFIAACEWLCRSLDGKAPASLAAWQPAEIMQTLGLPVEKTGRILVLEDAARELGSCLSAAESS